MEISSTPFLIREQIRARVEKRLEAFEKGYRQNVGLIGPRGVGKTQVLTSMFHALAHHPSFLTLFVNACVLDFERLVERWVGALLTSVQRNPAVAFTVPFQSLLQQALPLIPKTAEKISNLKKMIRRDKGAACVKELFSLTGVLAEETGKKIVLMIDEFQALEALPVSDPFALFGKEMMLEKETFYFVASSSPARAREIFHDKLSLLFGNFEVMELTPFTFEEVEALAGHRFPNRFFSDAQKRFLVRMTDGIPEHIEFLMDQMDQALKLWTEPDLSLYPSSSRPVPDEVLLQAFYRELLLHKGRIALKFESRLAALARFAKDNRVYLKVLLAVSAGRRKSAPVAAFAGAKTLETKKILQRLVQEDILSKRGSFYLLEDPLFRFWLQEVYEKDQRLYGPESPFDSPAVFDTLRFEFDKNAAEEQQDLTARVETLFKEFHNDVVEIGGKKLQCPQFSEIVFRPTDGRVFPLLARNADTRWVCQIARHRIAEEDVASFLDELKRYRRGVHRKILFALAGIDQNAKLMAQAAKIQLWNLRSFNTLLDLFNQPKMIFFTQRETDGSTLGPVAQGLHSA